MESTFEFTGMDRTRPTLGLKGLEKRLRFPAALATVAKVVRCCKQDGKHFGLMKGDKVQAWRLHPWLDS